MDLFTFLIFIYSIWGFWCGWKFINGRWEALEKPGMKIIKVIVAFFIGLYMGILKLLEHIFKFVNF